MRRKLLPMGRPLIRTCPSNPAGSLRFASMSSRLIKDNDKSRDIVVKVVCMVTIEVRMWTTVAPDDMHWSCVLHSCTMVHYNSHARSNKTSVMCTHIFLWRCHIFFKKCHLRC